MGFEFTENDSWETLPEILRSYVPDFATNRYNEFHAAVPAMKSKDLAEVSSFCHKVVGVAKSYHFNKMYEIAKALQSFAKAGKWDEVALLIPIYTEYINDINSKFTKTPI